MAKLYDLSVKVGEYLKDGQYRNRYETIGAIWEGKKGGKFMTLKASFNPAAIERKSGDENIIISCFPPKEKQETQKPDYTGQKQDFDFKRGPEPSWDSADSGVPF